MRRLLGKAGLHLTLLFVALEIGGCTRAQQIAGAQPLSDGVRGKYWRSAEPMGLFPSTGASNLKVFGFDLATEAGGTKAQLVFSEANSTGGHTSRLVARAFKPTGFASPGPLFASLGDLNAGVTDARVVLANAKPGNALFAFAFDQSNGNVSSTFSAGGTWASPSFTVVASGPGSVTSTDLSQGFGFNLWFDPLGRGVLSYSSGTQLVQTSFVAASSAVVSLGANFSNNAQFDVSVIDDGTGNLCHFSRNSSSALEARCLSSITPAFSAVTATDLGDTDAGHAVAGDGAGRLLGVAYQDGKLASFLVESGSAAPLAAIAAATPPSAFARPAIVYLGAKAGTPLGANGAFLAAWVDFTGGVSQVFSSVYTLDDGVWSAPVAVTDPVSRVSLAYHQSIRLFSGALGNAAIGIKVIGTAGFGVTDHDWGTQAARYHIDLGWLSVQTLGGVCTGDVICSHPPGGAMLSSGETAIAYIDQDSAGLYSLFGIGFR